MRKGILILSLLGIALIAFLYFSPTSKPLVKEVEETTEEVSETSLSPDAQVDEALKQLQTGALPPMQAVLAIREVAEKYPKNVKANYTLGGMSMQTGQYEKAIQRFEAVLEVEPENTQALYLLAQSQAFFGDTTNAKINYSKAIEKLSGSEKEAAQEALENLSK